MNLHNHCKSGRHQHRRASGECSASFVLIGCGRACGAFDKGSSNSVLGVCFGEGKLQERSTINPLKAFDRRERRTRQTSVLADSKASIWMCCCTTEHPWRLSGIPYRRCRPRTTCLSKIDSYQSGFAGIFVIVSRWAK
jgi:hypothetical protein